MSAFLLSAEDVRTLRAMVAWWRQYRFGAPGRDMSGGRKSVESLGEEFICKITATTADAGRYEAAAWTPTPTATATGALAIANIGTEMLPAAANCRVWNIAEMDGSGAAPLAVGRVVMGRLLAIDVSDDAKSMIIMADVGGQYIRDIRWNSTTHKIQVTYDGTTWVDKITFDPDCP